MITSVTSEYINSSESGISDAKDQDKMRSNRVHHSSTTYKSYDYCFDCEAANQKTYRSDKVRNYFAKQRMTRILKTSRTIIARNAKQRMKRIFKTS